MNGGVKQKLKSYYEQSAAFIIVFGIVKGVFLLSYKLINRIAGKRDALENLYARASYKYLERFYRKNAAAPRGVSPEKPKALKPELIGQGMYWVFWWQGLEEAPAVVKACHASMRRVAAPGKIIVLTQRNFEEYAALPPHVIRKYKQGAFGLTHLSDLMRVYLLLVYGGVWIDATVLFTRPVPERLLSRDFFCFRDSLLQKIYPPVSSWFLISKPDNALLHKELLFLYKYWERHNFLAHYYIFHLVLNVLIDNDSECAEIFKKMPYYNNSSPHYLQLELLFDDFSGELWENVLDASFCHKLTYKYDSSRDIKNTFLAHILKEFGE